MKYGEIVMEAKPVLFLDNDCLSNIFGRASLFNEQRGRSILDRLKSLYDLRITDTVFYTEIAVDEVNPKTNKKWPMQSAKESWLADSKTPIEETSGYSGKDRGEKSIIEAVKRTSESLGRLGPKIFIASDDKYFKSNQPGGEYAEQRFTSKDLIKQAEEMEDAISSSKTPVIKTDLKIKLH
jgi:hypothetical protein